jgi:hypothetical protein
MPTEVGERKMWLENMVGKALCFLDPEGTGTILFCKQGRGDGHSIPMVEVRIESKETAKRIRASYVNKKKNNVDLEKLFVANCVTLATRVRADILRAIANKHNKKGRFELYVTLFSSRPVLHVKDIDGNKAPYALTFTDAVSRYGSSLGEEDLGEAYRRAGRNFERQMSQLFVVLKEDPNNSRVFAPRGANRGSGSGSGAYRGKGYERGRGGKTRGFIYGRGKGNQDRGTKRPLDEQAQAGSGSQHQPQQQQQQQQQQRTESNRGYAVKRLNYNKWD